MTSPILFDIPVPITTPRLLLRPPMNGDGHKINEAIKEAFKELTVWMPWAQTMPSVDDSEIFARQSYAKWVLREQMGLLIFDRLESKLFGGTGFNEINWDLSHFEIGYWIRSSEVGKGYITETVNALTRFAFEVFKANRVAIRCDADNVKSANIPTRLGYQLEGRLRNNERSCDGQNLRDTLIFSRIDSKELPDIQVSWG